MSAVEQQSNVEAERKPIRSHGKENEVYVSRRTKVSATVSHIREALESQPEIIIRGVGIAIVRAIEVALQVQTDIPNVTVSPNTSTVSLENNTSRHAVEIKVTKN
eukprot:CAMPEP_0184657068 /NCGR_PEP_ID=MMETSP0308-20130426/16956_1 /TAXON_ID=38269 /ORGANISM="Gloeochaete witrockiana, Strain SAG 46.84" /LENGTH=104 /DNA_ID=CAMNT_0027094467 /DNA_START=29 /DNA_END=343 /DNA_ORIENTATION=+